MSEELRKFLPQSFSSRHSKTSSSRKNNESDDTFRLFEKKFQFLNDLSPWPLPNYEKMFKKDVWTIEELQAIKQELNSVKSKLNNYDIEEWHKHTKRTSKAGNIIWSLKKNFEPEFVTQAWCKLYEILMSFPIIPAKAIESQNVSSFHLCEAPGAFITSLNHFLKLHYPAMKWQWRATTLNPYYEGNPLTSMINDDRFILRTLPFWTFGCDSTGDIMNLNNINHVVEQAKQIGEIGFVTADGSIDCHENPAEQESEVSLLNYCETMIMLKILVKGGSFLLKLFTTYEAHTVCLLYLLCCAFGQVNMFKPATSKEGNSEVYVVCLNYKGKEFLEPVLEKIQEFIVDGYTDKVMFPLEEIPKNFIEQVLSCSSMYKNFQIETIEKNIISYGKSQDEYKIKRAKYLATQYFIEHYKIKELADKEQEVVGSTVLNKTACANLDTYIRRGSFASKMAKNFNSESVLSDLLKQLQEFKVIWSVKCDIKWFQGSHQELKLMTGKPVNTIFCSKFCSRHLLGIWNTFRESIYRNSGSRCSFGCCLHDFLKDSNPEELHQILKENTISMSANMKTVSFKSDYWCSINHNSNDCTEKRAFSEILSTLNLLNKGDDLLLTGYPLLTQFNVGLIFLITSLFEKVGLIDPNKQVYTIICIGFQPALGTILKELNKLEELTSKSRKEGCLDSVLALVPITKLCGYENTSHAESFEPESKLQKLGFNIDQIETSQHFYQCVTEMNTIFIKKELTRIIQNLRQKR